MSSDGPVFPIAAPLASSLLRGQCNPFLVTSFIQHRGGPHPIFYPAVEVVNPDQRLHGLQRCKQAFHRGQMQELVRAECTVHGLARVRAANPFGETWVAL